MNYYPVNDFNDPDEEFYEGDEEYYSADDFFAENYTVDEFVYPDEYSLTYPVEITAPVGVSPAMVSFATLIACAVLVLLLLKLAAGLHFPAATVSALSTDPDQIKETSLDLRTQNQSLTDESATIISNSEAAQAACTVSGMFPDKVMRWCSFISFYATKHELNPDLLAALIWLESGGNEIAYSKSGAVGLMQVMPNDGLAASFMCINGPCFSDRPSTAELQNPEFNIAYGTRMLAGLLRRHGNLREALRSYGPMNVGYYYADKVLGIFQKYQKAP